MADYLIDIGPDGGKEGGRIINKGTPQEVIKAGIGYTAEFLKEIYHS
jgi:excinuclease ABC subunit A